MLGKISLYYNDLVHSPSESFLSKDFGLVPCVLGEMHDCCVDFHLAVNNPNSGFLSFRGRPVFQYPKALKRLPAYLDVLKNMGLYRRFIKERSLTHLVVFPFTPRTDWAVVQSVRRRGARTRII